jgi:hypothetical protein
MSGRRGSASSDRLPEGARPELHAALKPGDDLAVSHHVRSVARRGFAARGVRPADLTAPEFRAG